MGENKDQENFMIVQDKVTYKKKIITILVPSTITTFLNYSLFLTLASFLPLYTVDYHPSISSTVISFIITATSVSMLISGPIIGLNMRKLGRKNMLLYGIVVNSTFIFCLGLTHFISNDIAFSIVSILLRFCQGIGETMVVTSCQAIIAGEFPENRRRFMIIFETCCALGIMTGPVLGSALYSILNYFWTFTILSLLMIADGIYVFFQLANSVNSAVYEEDTQDSSSEKDPNVQRSSSQRLRISASDITLSTFFKNRRCLFALSTVSFLCIFLDFNLSVFSIVLDSFGLSEVEIGLVFSLPMVISIFVSLGIYFIIDYLNLRCITFSAFVVSIFSLFLQGPSELLQLPNSLWILIVGYGLNGIYQPFIFNPCVPELIQAIYDKEQIQHSVDKEVDDAINDQAAGLYSTFTALGQIAGPIVGGILYGAFGYRTECDIMALFAFIYCVTYFVFNVLEITEKKRTTQMNFYKEKLVSN